MRNFLRAVFGSFTAKRERVIAAALKTEHAIDLHDRPGHVCTKPACPSEDAGTRALSDRMHEQSHRLHVLQWQASMFAAKIGDAGSEDPILVRMHSARPS